MESYDNVYEIINSVFVSTEAYVSYNSDDAYGEAITFSQYANYMISVADDMNLKYIDQVGNDSSDEEQQER